MNNATLTYTSKVHFKREAKGTLRLADGQATPEPTATVGRVPKIARLMALAIRFEGMLQRGEVRDYAELARLGRVSRARVTQVMNFLNLAPNIQEAILFLPPTVTGHDAVKEWQVRPIAAETSWAAQRRLWNAAMKGTRLSSYTA